ncbi:MULTISPECIES: hypothetical protein [unclassified Mesorhizobium]|uniref:hypothetical protein n=1 Tax=unclassified Mesorhizobium TaxID=325217 RepID=UPI001127562C|nr:MULTISPECIES: hypothetical protein [unclassified Mesorhizobium]MBZ9695642.1 hypothetical protein [Mesorhizobium sp. CO1-1-9]TPK15636.1 hypothetical protein FJ543_09505 [Mesorhizobium sp. B2-5-7]
MKNWNDRLKAPGINGVKPTPRTALAIEHGAEVTCPVTMGYHPRTVAEAAKEDLERGMTLSDVAPFWRVLDAKTPTTRKLSFGAEFVAAQRKREGLKP